MHVGCDCLVIHLKNPCISHKQAHPVLVVLEETEEGVLCKLVCQDIELCQAGQGGNGEQVVLVALHVLKMNCDSCDGPMDLVDSSDKICMGRAAWCKLLVVLSLMGSSQVVASHNDQPRGDDMERTETFDGQE